jgi:hypothetical protein
MEEWCPPFFGLGFKFCFYCPCKESNSSSGDGLILNAVPSPSWIPVYIVKDSWQRALSGLSVMQTSVGKLH